ncbi:MAG: SDR family NAD(P)-dependent oxidoreductase, partial [Alphaproteobacteria bacterium]|nr:SDR family NAD(P)-dependent oxidoreductase [Alphaproteobacteria bacterium]
MDLGIAGRRALVCAASRGLGRGCAEALAREGVEVTILARTAADIEQTAKEIAVMPCAAARIDPHRPRRHARGIRRDVRVSVQRASGLHRRA